MALDVYRVARFSPRPFGGGNRVMVIRQLAGVGFVQHKGLPPGGQLDHPGLHSAFRGETRDSLTHYLHGEMPISGPDGARVPGQALAHHLNAGKTGTTCRWML